MCTWPHIKPQETKEKKDSTSTIDDLEMLEEFPSDIEDVFQ